MKKEYKSDEAWNEAEINRVLRRNSGWKPIFMTPVIMPLTAEQIAKGWPPLIHFIIIFEREKEGSMKKLKEYWNRMKVNKYVEMLSQGKNITKEQYLEFEYLAKLEQAEKTDI